MSVKTNCEIDVYLDKWQGETKSLSQCYEWVKTGKLDKRGFLYMVTGITQIVSQINRIMKDGSDGHS